jgi:4-alpha-glucanotransferase
VGEDLGVVEPSAREFMLERGILGTSILWFEWDHQGDGDLLAPEKYRELCLSTVTTHDLPPTAGYLRLEHVAIRDRLGLLTRPVEEETAAEEATIARVRAALEARGLLEDDAGVPETVEALHRFIAQTPSKLLGVAVTDLVGDVRAVNQPGTDREYPNWSVPLSGPDGQLVTLEELMASPLARSIAERLR